MRLWQNEYVPTANRMVAALLTHTDWDLGEQQPNRLDRWAALNGLWSRASPATQNQTRIEVCGLNLSFSYQVDRSVEWEIEREGIWHLTAFGGGGNGGWTHMRLTSLEGDREQFERDAVAIILSKQEG